MQNLELPTKSIQPYLPPPFSQHVELEGMAQGNSQLLFHIRDAGQGGCSLHVPRCHGLTKPLRVVHTVNHNVAVYILGTLVQKLCSALEPKVLAVIGEPPSRLTDGLVGMELFPAWVV